MYCSNKPALVLVLLHMCIKETCFNLVNTPMQYTAIFHGLKNDNFQMKNCDIFLIFAKT